MRLAGLVAAAAALMLVSGCVVEASSGAATPSTPKGPPRPPAASPNIVTPSGFGAFQIGTLLTDLRGQGLTKNVRAHRDCPGDQLADATGAHSAVLHFRNGALFAVASDSRLHKTANGAWIGVTWDKALAAAGEKATILERDTDKKKSISLREPGTDLTVLVEFDYSLTGQATAVPVVIRLHAGNAGFLEGAYSGQGKEC